MGIHYIKHQNIDKRSWDACVLEAPNGLVYGMSWYLDIVCPNWDALVSDDYEAVMPLPWKQNLGIKYVYHPMFAQQLGVFYKETVRNLDLSNFLKKIPFVFIKKEVSLNFDNQIKHKAYKNRINYVLPIESTYEENWKYFSTNTRRNIKKAQKFKLKVDDAIPVNLFLQLKRDNMVNSLSDVNLETLFKLFNYLIENKQGKICGVYNENQQLVAAAFFIWFKNRITYLFSASNAEGQDKRAMFYIVNELIASEAGKNRVLDFEGSMIHSVARFFKGFGANTQNYSRFLFYKF